MNTSWILYQSEFWLICISNKPIMQLWWLIIRIIDILINSQTRDFSRSTSTGFFWGHLKNIIQQKRRRKMSEFRQDIDFAIRKIFSVSNSTHETAFRTDAILRDKWRRLWKQFANMFLQLDEWMNRWRNIYLLRYKLSKFIMKTTTYDYKLHEL